MVINHCIKIGGAFLISTSGDEKVHWKSGSHNFFLLDHLMENLIADRLEYYNQNFDG